MLRKLSKTIARWVAVWISLALFLGSTAPEFQDNKLALADAAETIDSYLPMTWRNYPWRSLFGVEIISQITSESPIFNWAPRLPTKWVRLNQRISWRELQPNEGDPIQWDLLANFENELHILQAYSITPIVIVDDYPAWATTERSPGVPSYCGPLQADKFEAFAIFASQLANRYKTGKFNVHVWELGNEPDIDGDLFSLPLDSQYGCWGDVTDLEYYGGRLYGEMLKIVAPAIKAADPLAQVWVGGLLLNSPNSIPGEGRPEFFLRGILEAGVGTDFSYIDVVPYHAYTVYRGKDPLGHNFDYDNGDVNSPWYGDTWGGVIQGKAKFLQEIMSAYGVQKPLFVNEISLTCPEEFFPSLCNPPVEDFLQMQADHLVRVHVRGLSAGIVGFTWYTLDGPGWRNGGLLDGVNEARPSYLAYQMLVQQLINADYLASVDYGTDFEAYAFRRGIQDVHVVWTKLDVSGLTILVPEGNFIEARSRDGTLIAPVLVDGNYQIPVGFSPTYVVRRP
jgi:hypothetical protein